MIAVLLTQIGLVTPIAMTATVTVEPEQGRFEVAGSWTLANRTDEPIDEVRFELMAPIEPTVSSSVGTTSVDGRTLHFTPAIAPNTTRTVSFGFAVLPKETSRLRLNVDEVFLDAGAEPFYPLFEGPANLRICARVPEGWTAAVPGDPVAPHCGRVVGTQHTILAARRYAVVLRDGPFTVVVAAKHAAHARALLNEVDTIARSLQARFGRAATETLEVVEVSIDSAYSMNGVIALPLHVAESVASDGREIPFLAHEIAHQWFGSLVRGGPALDEGLSTFMGLERARDRGEGEAYVATLIDREKRARPGATIRTIRPEARWSDYDAVAYARAALAWDRLQQEIGRDRFDELTRNFLATHRGRRVGIDAFVSPLDFDHRGFIETTIDSDWNPATNRIRPVVRIIDERTFRYAILAAALGVLFVGWRLRRRRLLVVDAAVMSLATYTVHQQGWIETMWAALTLSIIVGAMMAGYRRRTLFNLHWVGWSLLVALSS